MYTSKHNWGTKEVLMSIIQLHQVLVSVRVCYVVAQIGDCLKCTLHKIARECCAWILRQLTV